MHLHVNIFLVEANFGHSCGKTLEFEFSYSFIKLSVIVIVIVSVSTIIMPLSGIRTN